MLFDCFLHNEIPGRLKTWTAENICLTFFKTFLNSWRDSLQCRCLVPEQNRSASRNLCWRRNSSRIPAARGSCAGGFVSGKEAVLSVSVSSSTIGWNQTQKSWWRGERFHIFDEQQLLAFFLSWKSACLCGVLRLFSFWLEVRDHWQFLLAP